VIGKLTGRLDSVGADTAIIDVGGVGYVVHASTRALGQLPAPGEMVSMLIETQVREDAIQLFGFLSAAEREWFGHLTSVQGVGGRVGLAILGALTPEELSGAIALQDKTTLCRANGVGPKLGQRIVMELKDKAGPAIVASGLGGAALAGEPSPDQADAISALVNLGYGLPEANRAIQAAIRNGGENTDAGGLIRLGLKELAR